jgi:hypothetical protein
LRLAGRAASCAESPQPKREVSDISDTTASRSQSPAASARSPGSWPTSIVPSHRSVDDLATVVIDGAV